MDENVAGSVVEAPRGSGEATVKVADVETAPPPQTAEPNPTPEIANPNAELVPVERVRNLQSANDRLRSRLGELEQRLAAVDGAAEAARLEAGTAQQHALTNLRRALLAEHAGRIVPELVAGDSPETLEASVELARAAFDRAAESARTSLGAQMVPAGTPPRSTRMPESATPLDRIAEGLRG